MVGVLMLVSLCLADLLNRLRRGIETPSKVGLGAGWPLDTAGVEVAWVGNEGIVEEEEGSEGPKIE
jgi:hypothetical protein